jgi:ankyrin repeat protein
MHPEKTSESLGRTPLHYAAFDGNVSAVRALLRDGADPSVVDANGWTPLHAAAQTHSPELVEVLLEHGAPVDAEDIYGNTPLFRAVFESRGRSDVIHLLRSAGADPTHVNRHGISPVQLARTIANYDIAQYFSDVVPKPVA